MIKIVYTLPDEESIESATRTQTNVTKVTENDGTVEMLQQIVENLYNQNLDLTISIKAKLPK